MNSQVYRSYFQYILMTSPIFARLKGRRNNIKACIRRRPFLSLKRMRMYDRLILSFVKTSAVKRNGDAS